MMLVVSSFGGNIENVASRLGGTCMHDKEKGRRRALLSIDREEYIYYMGVRWSKYYGA
jgi:hypothetical protein